MKLKFYQKINTKKLTGYKYYPLLKPGEKDFLLMMLILNNINTQTE